MSGAPDLEAELITAIGRACYAARLAPSGIPLGFSRHLMTGVSRVEFFRAGRVTCYQPAEDGRRALIVAVSETLYSTVSELIAVDDVTGIAIAESEPAGRELIDLCAVDLLTQQVGTRLGIGTVLGRDAIDDVRFNGGVLRLVDRPSTSCASPPARRSSSTGRWPPSPSPTSTVRSRRWLTGRSKFGVRWHWPSVWSAPSAVHSLGRTCG